MRRTHRAHCAASEFSMAQHPQLHVAHNFGAGPVQRVLPAMASTTAYHGIGWWRWSEEELKNPTMSHHPILHTNDMRFLLSLSPFL